jgi:hypothetical protein
LGLLTEESTFIALFAGEACCIHRMKCHISEVLRTVHVIFFVLKLMLRKGTALEKWWRQDIPAS